MSGMNWKFSVMLFAPESVTEFMNFLYILIPESV